MMFRIATLLLVCLAAGVRASCDESDQIECESNSRCTRLNYLCDGDNDCGDYSDEEDAFCTAWRAAIGRCSRGYTFCKNKDECVNMQDYCRDPDDCENEDDVEVDMRLCEILKAEKLQNIEDVILPELRRVAQEGGDVITENLNDTIHKGEDFMSLVSSTFKSEGDACPQLYTSVDGTCLSIFFFGNMTWGEAEKFCEVIGGSLYVPDKPEDFDVLTHHLKSHPIQSDFWIGGNFHNNTYGWRWIDNREMPLISNHWAVKKYNDCFTRTLEYKYREGTVEANDGTCYHEFQAPYVSNPFGSCVGITYKRYFFMSDEDCNLKKSPLCKLNKK